MLFTGALLPWLLCLVLALATVRLMQPWLPPPPDAGRFQAIDGLRGYLALGVFIHHGAFWLNYRHHGTWDGPLAPLHAHLGHDSVALFFMITAFLFTTKLLDARGRVIDWPAMAASRVMRLMPLYAVAMVLLLLAVVSLTQGRLQVPPWRLASELLHWLPLSVAGRPDINGVPETQLILAGVTWSLAYEVLFYAALPWLAVLMGHRVGWRLLLGSAAVTAVCLFYNHKPVWFAAFAVGALVAVAVRRPALKAWGAGWLAGALGVAGAVLAMLLWDDGREFGVVLLLGGLFFTVACGQSLGGLLTHRLSRQLGELAYSLYLLHGLLLFALLHGDIGGSTVAPWVHWTEVLMLTPLLVGLSVFTHLGVERPGMRSAGALLRRLRRLSPVRP